MTDKELLLKDICARLPYGVKLRFVEDLVVKKVAQTITMNNIYLEHIINGDADIKPYLRPMSSMTEEEQQKYYDLTHQEDDDIWAKCLFDKMVDFCNEKHLDYRGLIPMGLALEAPEGMYK